MKLVLLFQCRADGAFVPTYLAVVRPITRQIILGLVLLLLSGIGFMAIGHSFTPRRAKTLNIARDQSQFLPSAPAFELTLALARAVQR